MIQVCICQIKVGLCCTVVLQVLALVVFLPVGRREVRVLCYRGLTLACSPALAAASLYAESLHRRIGPQQSPGRTTELEYKRAGRQSWAVALAAAIWSAVIVIFIVVTSLSAQQLLFDT